LPLLARFAGHAAAQPAVPETPVASPSTPAPAAALAQSVTPKVLSDEDVRLYRSIMAAERKGQTSRAKTLLAKVSDTSLAAYAQAQHFLSAPARRLSVKDMVEWLRDNRDLAVADRVYRLAVAHSTRKVRRHHKTIIVAVVTNIPAPSSVGSRSGGYEDAELPEPTPDGSAARSRMPAILADIKDSRPDDAAALLAQLKAAGGCSNTDLAILSHRIAASYRAEGQDEPAYRLATSVSDPQVPQLLWDAGFAAYRLGHWAEAAAALEKLAQSNAAQSSLRAQGAFWAARAYMRNGEPAKVIALLELAAKQNPSFYGILAEHALGIDTDTGLSDPVLTQADFDALMRAPAARRAVALWQIGEKEFVGSELNRAFVNNDERLDPAMAALARAIGVPNVELRASEKSAARGIMLTGLFPVPDYRPEGGYRIDASLVLAFARIESRFQAQATSPAGARGLMQLMPATARKLGVRDPDDLYDPSIALTVGQRYIERLLNRLDGNLLEIGGAYNAGPQAVDRWVATKAGKDDPLLFVESIPFVDTRAYVKRLMLYHWLYRRRFGRDATSLDATARGKWPIYRPASGDISSNRPPAAASALIKVSDEAGDNVRAGAR
jgi:soluble lytic murein transglycosylase-like protein